MGFSRKRMGPRGVRYAAVYRDASGNVRHVGSYLTRREADRAWQRAEARQEEGRPTITRHGGVTFRRYVDETWLRHHVIEPSTKEGYRYCLDRHLMPFFGSMKLVDVTAPRVREWVTWMVERDVSPASIRHVRIILSAIFTTAVNDQLVPYHPVKGIKTPTVPVKEFRIVTPDEFDLLYAALPDEFTQLLVETAVESGLRWGELTELRVHDLDPRTGILVVSRAVCQVDPKFHPEGLRYYVKPYPKSKRSRRFKLSASIVAKIGDHVAAQGLGRNDLIFTMTQVSRPQLMAVPDPATLGLTEPNARGRQYAHGSLSGYSAGKCRCEHCRAAYAIYRGNRRARGLDDPRTPRLVDTDGHLSRAWFTRQVWKPALERAGLPSEIRMHDLRHAHASWLLAGGADLQVVKERLGHISIATTEKYLHTLPGADETALAALDRIRTPRSAR
jgi:integrase